MGVVAIFGISTVSLTQIGMLFRLRPLVIGCTGTTSLPFTMHQYLKKECILFSVSSSDREFDAVHFRKKTQSTIKCHKTIEVEGKTLLNCGFPINFDGGRHSVPAQKIQLTRALVLAAIFQAHEPLGNPSGIIPLDSEMQKSIIQKHLQIHSSTTFLKNPSDIL